MTIRTRASVFEVVNHPRVPAEPKRYRTQIPVHEVLQIAMADMHCLLMKTVYTKCNSCGVPILQRTFDRTGGYCKNCGYRENAPPQPPRVYAPEIFDPLETDPDHEESMRVAYDRAVDAAEREIQTALPYLEFTRDDFMMEFCHVIWRHKKRILREEFGLEWQSPAELNPHVFYD